MYFELKNIGKKIYIKLFVSNLGWVVDCPQKMRKIQYFPKYMNKNILLTKRKWAWIDGGGLY